MERKPRPPQKQSSRDPTFNCTICMEHDLPSSYEFMPDTTQCYEHGRFCKQCMATYIKVEVEQGTAYVMCPMPSCDWILDPISCKGLVTREVFNRWCDRLCEWDILGFERCYCPNRDCQELIVNECGLLRREKIRCPSCGKSCCFQCASPWDEADDHRCDNDVQIFVESKNWKQCPGCKNYVERHKGCNIIFCRCQTQFCYYCGATRESHFCSCSKSIKGTLGWVLLIVIIYILLSAILLLLMIHLGLI